MKHIIRLIAFFVLVVAPGGVCLFNAKAMAGGEALIFGSGLEGAARGYSDYIKTRIIAEETYRAGERDRIYREQKSAAKEIKRLEKLVKEQETRADEAEEQDYKARSGRYKDEGRDKYSTDEDKYIDRYRGN